MKKAYRTYKRADIDEARNLLNSDNEKKAVIYKDGEDFKLAISVFVEGEKGVMRHVIFPDTLSEMCENNEESKRLFEQIRTLKNEGNLYYRLGSLENPARYTMIAGPVTEEMATEPDFILAKLPLFRENENFTGGMDIEYYVNRSKGMMEKLDETISTKVLSQERDRLNINWRRRANDTSRMSILYRLEKNADGTFPELAAPAPAPSSETEVQRISDLLGIEPENGEYTKGLKFTPIMGMDQLPQRELKALLAGNRSESFAKVNGVRLFSSPYVFNIRKSNGEVRHDIIIDPVKATDIIASSKMLEIPSGTLVANGVFCGSLVEYSRDKQPPLEDDVYLFSEGETEALYTNQIGVSRVFRDPYYDNNAKLLTFDDIAEKEAAGTGSIRSVYVPSFDFAQKDTGYNPFTETHNFSKSAHNHYVTMMTKYGYLKKSGELETNIDESDRTLTEPGFDWDPPF